MKKTIISATVFALFACVAGAQDIYTMERLTSEDLAGTARFVGMGGAMSALGADISTMATNPAGIGLYRRADIATSLSVVAQTRGHEFDNHNKTHLSYDQIGIVYPFKIGGGAMRYLNVGFNYHKRKNLRQLTAADQQPAGGASQTWEMSDASAFWGGTDQGTPLAVAGYQTYLYEKAGTTDNAGMEQYNVYNATRNSYRKSATGAIQQYDFNVSTNIADRYYFGLTMGVYNIDADSYSEYTEALASTDNIAVGSYLLRNDRSLSGSGVDFKLGAIIYPFEEGSFRLGVSVATPVWFSLTENCTSYLNSTIHQQQYDYRTEVGDHDYDLCTPWKFCLAAGGTVGNFLALDAEYEYSDYGSASISYDDDGNDWGWSDNQTKDRQLNRQAKRYLKGVSTVRLGAETKLDYGLALRVGYNYVSSPIKSRALQNQYINSASIDYITATNYTNLGDINRFTVGLGYKAKHLYADFAYQYQKQSGEFYAFSTQGGNDTTPNEAPKTNLKLDKSQFLLTLGYKF